MVEAFLILIMVLMVIKFAFVWDIWKRMNQFEDTFERIGNQLDELIAD